MCNIIFDATIKDYLKEIDEAPLLSAREENYLGKLIVAENDPIAREQLVRSNLRLVVNIAKKYANRGMSLADLIEEGNLGLIKAVDYFDPERGTRFSTYAAWWIKQSIKSALLADVRPVHVPSYMIGLMNRWRRTATELEVKLGRRPGLEEMADMMRMPLRKAKIIKETVKILTTVKDCADVVGDDEEQSFEAALRYHDSDLPEDELVADEEKGKVMGLLTEIDQREAEILRLHYGLDGRKQMTLKDIAAKMGLTRERIRQIQHEALTKLYEYMNEE
jgi:RNA polymerase primary sigma factor